VISRTAGQGAAVLPIGTAALFLLVLLPGVAIAQKKSTKAPTKSVSTQLADQRREIEAQRARIAEQQATIEGQIAHADSQAVRIDSLTITLGVLSEQMKAMNLRLADVEAQAGRAIPDSLIEARLKQVEAAAKKSPELPPDIVSAGDFPGSIRIPGTDAAVKFGGRVRTAAVFTLDPLGTDDRFLTNSIPVGATAVSGEEKRTNISARASRLNIEFRTPVGAQEVRDFFEGDFAGAGNAFRLRHAYAQFLGFIVGQTWSTFSDPQANVEDLDFEGISSENVIRQPLIRYWWYADPRTRVALAAETPSVSLTGGNGVNLMPDLIVRAVRSHGEEGHVQVAAVARQIRGEATAGDVRSEWGWGLSASGVFPFKFRDLQDRIIFQANGGKGIARYINDLNSLGGQDGVFDSTSGDLHPLPAVGWYIGYEHSWKEWKGAETMNLRSTFLWSFVDVSTFDFQPPDAYNTTHRFAVNLVFSPSNRVDVGIEAITGSRENKDKQVGHATQLQAVALIRF
jgi:outer membrane DcaP-like protein